MEYQLKKEGKFEFIEEGNGPVLLLLHGLFGALSNWSTVLDHFSKNYTVVIPLMPIYQMALPKTSVAGLADFIHEFMKFRKYPPVTLLGNSLGGHVGLVYTLKHQENVNALILTGSSGLYENAMGGSFPPRQNYEFIKAKTAETFYDPEVATKELVDEVYDIVNSRLKGLRIVMMAKSAIRHNVSDEIHKIKVPVCLIWGKNDTITPPEVAEEFHELLPNSELHWIDKCAHAPMMEKPEEFNNILDGFLLKVNEAAKTH
ncbi:MAG: alpha/beta hydrolase [Sphingobacteriales bacterium]|nr:MAG: alpha/beta hydrolase [Sphingobacteriales bacterium]